MLAALLDAIYPRLCRLCDEVASSGDACPVHALRVEPRARCARCAAPLGRGLPDGFACSACRAQAPPFARALAWADYRDDAGVREWLLALKHRGRRDLAEPLGAHLARLLEGVDEPGVLVPVPLHPWRAFERGYDQAALLAQAAARRRGWPVARALVRTRATAVQGAVDAPGRRANVHGAFALDPWAARALEGRVPWLVDDVVTSGATAAEAARTLRRGGARCVGLVCVARAGAALSSAR